MQAILQLFNKINQLDAGQRRDIEALLEILPPLSQQAPTLVRMLPRQLPSEYLHCWASAAGGSGKELSTFLRGALTQLCLTRASFVNVCSDSNFLIFTVLFHEDCALDSFVRPDRMETFYVMHGTLELTLRLRGDHLRFHLCSGEVNQVYPGTPYQLSASGGTQAVLVHSWVREDSEWGIYLGTRELTGLGGPTRVTKRSANEIKRSETA